MLGGLDAWLSNPAVLAPVCTLLGVVLSQMVQGFGEKKNWQLASVKVTLSLLQDEVGRLSGRVDALEAEVSLLVRKLRAALDWARSLLAWGEEVSGLVDAGTDVPAAPGVPELLAEDY